MIKEDGNLGESSSSVENELRGVCPIEPPPGRVDGSPRRPGGVGVRGFGCAGLGDSPIAAQHVRRPEPPEPEDPLQMRVWNQPPMSIDCLAVNDPYLISVARENPELLAKKVGLVIDRPPDQIRKPFISVRRKTTGDRPASERASMVRNRF
jgi:hypothetical protein